MPPHAEAGRPAIFLDRDGTVLVERHYLSDPDGVELLPDADRALQTLKEAGFALVLVTNQSGIARGLYTEADFQAVQRRLGELLRNRGLVLDAVYHCPHHPQYTGPCACRKPGTALFQRAQHDLGLDLYRSAFVGDRAHDVTPALELGGLGVLVQTGYGGGEAGLLPAGIHLAADLQAAATIILDSRLGRAGR